MKKIIITVILLVLCSGCQSNSDKQVLRIYNWGEYIGEDVISNFESAYNCKVQYDIFPSNEEMYTKLKSGETWDILVPSDYMIERLMQEKYLQKLDKTKIPNLDKLADGVKNLPYDPNNDYAVPYFWGSVGIIYNSDTVSKSDVEEQGYNVLKNPKYKGKMFIYDSERDSFMMAFKALGYSMNTTNKDEVQAAYNWLKELNDNNDPTYVTDEVIDGMVSNQKDIGIVYSGDAAYILSENSSMRYFLPKEGTNLWSDSMVIPNNAKNPELANEFINFILDYESSYDNSLTVGYASTNQEVLDDMVSEGGDFNGNPAYLPRSNYAKDEVFAYDEEMKKELANLWIRVKSS
ncbi:MAG: ABC transporter substrate-binding protein [Erysipelotrichaceae bacterium]